MKKYFLIESLDEKTDLNGVIWQPTPSGAPKAIVQIAHGMAEHIERYHDVATYLNEHNILVVGHDHLGHGDSINFDDPLYGYFSKGDSPKILIEDTYQITHYIQKRYPHVPLFILGHSMGSFIVRNYLKTHSDSVNGAIIMGTGGRRDEIKLANKLLKGLNSISPKTVNPALHHLMFHAFNNKFKPAVSPNAWLSKNEDNVLTYDMDERAGFTFTNNGFYTLLSLMDQATNKHWFKTIRTNLPILIVSGEKDPVGNFGKAPRKLAVELTDHYFSDITLRLYHDLRHEILNEQEAVDIMNDIYDWVTSHLEF